MWTEPTKNLAIEAFRRSLTVTSKFFLTWKRRRRERAGSAAQKDINSNKPKRLLSLVEVWSRLEIPLFSSLKARPRSGTKLKALCALFLIVNLDTHLKTIAARGNPWLSNAFWENKTAGTITMMVALHATLLTHQTGGQAGREKSKSSRKS